MPEDMSFIKHSWLTNFYEAFLRTEVAIKNSTFKARQFELIENILDNPNAITLIACDQFEPEMILGYLVAELASPRVYMHWAYTKHGLRSYGIFKSLFGVLKDHLSDETLVATHMTPYALRFVKHNELRYEPLLWDWKRHEQRFNEISKRKIYEANLSRISSI